MPRPRNVKPWTMEEALTVVRELQPALLDLRYHVTLGGGVLNTGASEKDLDLFILPLNGYDSEPWQVVKMLGEVFGEFGQSIRDSPDYQTENMWHYQEMRYFMYLGRRIDVFIQ